MNLLQYQRFKMHSGNFSDFKIECDALAQEDYDTIAKIIIKKFEFSEVHGVPRGGIPFALSLGKHLKSESKNVLIVDDVFTTGTSMNEARNAIENNEEKQIIGIVLFARNPTPSWIYPVFYLHSMFNDV